MGDLFEARRIAPMLIAENADPFTDEDYLYEIKWDGERCVAFLDPAWGTDLRNKRGVRMLPKVPELSDIHRQTGGRCVLDGELLCVVDGKPDFEAIQRRSLMAGRHKIELEARRRPASFIAFDCLYFEGRDLTMYPLSERKEFLRKAVVEESERLALSRAFDARQADELVKLTRAQNLEGVVAKRKDSLYFQGRRTKNWVKIKNMQDDDFVICGYAERDDHMTGVVLGQYQGDALRYQGRVAFGVRGAVLAKIKGWPRLSASPFPLADAYRSEDTTVWLEPGLVCRVAFMNRTKGGGIRQPVFKGLREDKIPEECVVPRSLPLGP